MDNRVQLTAILARHERLNHIRNNRIHCSCGWDKSIFGMRSSKGGFNDHLAEMLESAIQEREDESWDYGYDEGFNHPDSKSQSVNHLGGKDS